MILCHLLESIFSIQAMVRGISPKKALIQDSISKCEGHGWQGILSYRYSSCLSVVEKRKLCCWVSFWWSKMAFSARSTSLSLTWTQIADAHQRQNLKIPWHTTMEHHLFQMISNYKTIFPLRSVYVFRKDLPVNHGRASLAFSKVHSNRHLFQSSRILLKYTLII